MVLPNTRFRAQRRFNRILEFEKIVGVETGTGAATATITTLPTTLIIFAAADGIDSSALTVDSVAATPLGTQANTRMWAVSVGAGPHTVALSGISQYGTLVVASYIGVTEIGAFAGASGVGNNSSVTLPGAGSLAVAAVVGPYAAYPAWSGLVSGDERIRQDNPAKGAFSSNCMAVADSTTGAPSYSFGSGGWTEVGVWLS